MPNRPPLISVIVPAFNAEDTVPLLVEDFLAQTYGNIEVVCVDDGSNDGTRACIQHLSRVYENVCAVFIEHGGPSTAREAGLLASRGEWVTFADADDRVEPGWIESLAAGGHALDPSGCADIIAGANCWKRGGATTDGPFGEGEETLTEYQGLFYRGSRMDEVWKRMLLLPGDDSSISHSMCDKLFRRGLARGAIRGIDRSIRIGEDTCFCIAAFARARAVSLTYARGYRWTSTPGSLSHTADVCAVQDYRAVYAHVWRSLVAHGYGQCAAGLWHEWMSRLMERTMRHLVADRNSADRLAEQFVRSFELDCQGLPDSRQLSHT